MFAHLCKWCLLPYLPMGAAMSPFHAQLGEGCSFARFSLPSVMRIVLRHARFAPSLWPVVPFLSLKSLFSFFQSWFSVSHPLCLSRLLFSDSLDTPPTNFTPLSCLSSADTCSSDHLTLRLHSSEYRTPDVEGPRVCSNS